MGFQGPTRPTLSVKYNLSIKACIIKISKLPAKVWQKIGRSKLVKEQGHRNATTIKWGVWFLIRPFFKKRKNWNNQCWMSSLGNMNNHFKNFNKNVKSRFFSSTMNRPIGFSSMKRESLKSHENVQFSRWEWTVPSVSERENEKSWKHREK